MSFKDMNELHIYGPVKRVKIYAEKKNKRNKSSHIE